MNDTTTPWAFDAENAYLAFEGLWCSGQLSAADIARLPALGVGTVINLAPPNASKVLAGEAEQVTALGLNYVQIPVSWDAPSPHQFELFAGVMAAVGHQAVWLHCARNMRASAFVYLYRLLVRGEGELQSAWPMSQVWTPNPVWQQWITAVRSARGAGAVQLDPR